MLFSYIVVETNYRIYAYTDSNLQIALLGLFTEVLYRFPNLCVGVITRASIILGGWGLGILSRFGLTD